MRLSWPLPPDCKRITQRFGANPDYYAEWGYPGHPALDIACDAGTEVYAVHEGWTEPRYNAVLGRHIRINSHDGSLMTRYSHLSRVDVDYGQHVRKGEQIGLSGRTGQVMGDHLDLGLKEDGAPYDPAYRGWIDPEPYLKEATMTKTSAHIQKIFPWMQQALVDLGTDWVKFVNAPPGPDPMPRVKNKLVRLWTDDIDSQFIPRGEEGGRDFVRHMLPQWRERPWATCYSLANEPECNSNEGLANLCAYSIGAMREASANGIKLVILDLPEGNPGDNETSYVDVSAWKLLQLTPAVKEAIALGHYVGLHAYWRPGAEGPLGRWHALGRIEWDVEIWRQDDVDISKLKLLVTEWGVDGGIAPEKPGHSPKTGWLTLCDPVTYFREVAEGEQRAQQLPWLKGLLLFDWGPESEWLSFGHDEGFVRNLIMAMPNLPMSPVEPPPSAPSKLTDAERARLRGFFAARVPATLKDAIARGRVFIGEVPETPNLYIAWDPAYGRYEICKLDPQTWQLLDSEPL